MNHRDEFDDGFYETPEFKKTLNRYEQMAQDGRTEYFAPDELTDIAEYYAINGRKDEAEAAIGLALQFHPDSTDPQIFRARTVMLEGDTVLARELAQAIPDQEDREVTFLYAEILFSEGNPEEALALLTGKLIHEDDTLEDRYLALKDIVMLCADYRYCSPEVTRMAKEWVECAGNKDIFSPEESILALRYLASCYVEEGRRTEAIPLFNRILDEDSYDSWSWLNLGDAYMDLERYSEAIDAYDYVLAIEPDNLDAYFEKGECFFRLGNGPEALKIFEESLQRGFDPRYGNFVIGRYYSTVKDFASSTEYLLKALAARPEEPDDEPPSFDIYYILCGNLVVMDMPKEAENYYELAVKEAPDHPGLEVLRFVMGMSSDPYLRKKYGRE